MLNFLIYFRHAADVVQMCFMFIKETKLQQLLQKVDCLTLLIAAVGHGTIHYYLDVVTSYRP